MKKTEIQPIAYIQTDFKEKFGIPRQSLKAKSLIGKIVFCPEFRNSDALRGIEEFSHLWLIFDFSKAHRKGFSPTVRPPRLGGNKRIGVFASRSPFRPNNLGLSSVELVEIKKTENQGDILIVRGADLLNNTPIYDIKPYLSYTDSHPDAKCGYADKMLNHKLNVIFNDELLSILPQDKREGAIEVLSEDPRPSYQNDLNRVYTMNFAGYEISFRVKDTDLYVTDVN